MYERICKWVIGPVFLGLGLLTAGCGEKSWYDSMSEEDRKKDAYIQTQVDAGVDPEEASRQYEMNKVIYRTEGRHE